MMRSGFWAIVVVVMFLALPAFTQAQVISYYSGPPVVVSDPVVTYYPPAPVVSYYSGPPVVSYYSAPAPVVSYYAPAPVVSYYAPAVSYYAPAVSYYAPAPVYYSAPAPVTVSTYRYGLFGRRSVTTVNYGW